MATGDESGCGAAQKNKMSKRKRKPITGICALCGLSGIVTREHVPPKCIFVKPRPQNTITVPVCEKCNHSYHLDDEYFRVLVSVSPQPNAQQRKLWDDKVVGSSFTRSGGLRNHLLEISNKIHESAMKQPLLFDDGTPLSDELIPYVQGFEMDRINTVLEKIVKCLYFHHFKGCFDGEVEVDSSCDMPKNKIVEIISKGSSGQVGFKNEFLYGFNEVVSGDLVWLLVFFEYHYFVVRQISR